MWYNKGMSHGLENATHFLLRGSNFCKCENYNRSMEEKRRMVKMDKTDCMKTEQLFRLIQSIPSPKAESFKLWMAQVAKEILKEMQKYELSLLSQFSKI